MADILQQPVPQQCDGISLFPVLKGGTAKQPTYRYWEFWRVLPKGSRTKEYLDKQGITCQAVRSGKWKAFRGYGNHNLKGFQDKPPAPDCDMELYDLEADPGETTNLAADYSEIVDRMAAYMAEAHTPLKTKPKTRR